jgi:hypothetical protein
VASVRERSCQCSDSYASASDVALALGSKIIGNLAEVGIPRRSLANTGCNSAQFETVII